MGGIGSGNTRKVDYDQVVRLYETRCYSQATLGELLGVNEQTIGVILRGRNVRMNRPMYRVDSPQNKEHLNGQ